MMYYIIIKDGVCSISSFTFSGTKLTEYRMYIFADSMGLPGLFLALKWICRVYAKDYPVRNQQKR